MIVTGDLHLTDKRSDSYRFDFFRWLRALDSNGSHELVILGDLTDKKNYHSSLLVNRVVDSLVSMLNEFSHVVVLQGNHDLESEDGEAPPFFRFLDRMPNIHFIDEPNVLPTRGYVPSVYTNPSGPQHGAVMFLPHRRDFMKQWQEVCARADVDSVLFIFMHQTVAGSFSESGQQLDGVPPSLFRFDRFRCPVVSGDIHVPQRVGPVTYVGSPYPIRFGDSFAPRVLRLSLDSQGETVMDSIPVPSIAKKKVTLYRISDLDTLSAGAGDQLKVVYVLPAAEFEEWPNYRNEIRSWADGNQVELHSVEFVIPDHDEQASEGAVTEAAPTSTPHTVLDRYAAREGISDDLLHYGKRFLA